MAKSMGVAFKKAVEKSKARKIKKAAKPKPKPKQKPKTRAELIRLAVAECLKKNASAYYGDSGRMMLAKEINARPGEVFEHGLEKPWEDPFCWKAGARVKKIADWVVKDKAKILAKGLSLEDVREETGVDALLLFRFMMKRHSKVLARLGWEEPEKKPTGPRGLVVASLLTKHENVLLNSLPGKSMEFHNFRSHLVMALEKQLVATEKAYKHDVVDLFLKRKKEELVRHGLLKL